MKATLRSSAAAAAVLLVSLGATLVSQPAAAQHTYGYAQPAVVAQGEFRGERDRWEQRHGRFVRDDRGPWIGEITASQGDRGWTRISARFGDQGSGVDPASVVLRIDGRDVTRRARVDGDDVRYADDLRPGRHVAELVVSDRAGNATRRAWAFDVVGHGRNYGYSGYHGGERW